MNRKEPVITLDSVWTTYEGAGNPIIQDVSLSIYPGEFVVVGGPNGAGKTTLLESIAGLIPVVGGTVTVLGMNAAKEGVKVRRQLGYVIQNFEFPPVTPFIVEEVVIMGKYGQLGWFHRHTKDDHEAARKALDQLGILHLAKKPIGTLSGGQQQRVLIAQSLIKDPKLLLLDEPFSNLDISSRDQVSELLCKLTDDGVTVVIVSHAFDALPHRDIRVVVMEDGCVCKNGVYAHDAVTGVIRNHGVPVAC